MKLWGFLLLELGAVGTALTFAVVGGGVYASRRAEAWEVQQAAPAATVNAPPRPLDPPPVDVLSTPAGTFTGIKDELLLESIHVQPVQDVKFNLGGSSISLRITFADGSRSAFKPMQTNVQTEPRKEIAAYRLNRLLGLNGVPPAVSRTLHRDDLFGRLVPEARGFLKRLQAETIFDEEGFTRGQVSYWIPKIVDSGLDQLPAIEQWTRWLTVGEEIPAEKRGLMAQLSSLLVFDLLQNNSDRFSGGNLMTSPDGKTLYYMDNTFGFQVQPEGHERCRDMLNRCQKFSRRLAEALARLDAHALRGMFSPDPIELSEAELASILARRDVALRHVERLVTRFGADRVLVFP